MFSFTPRKDKLPFHDHPAAKVILFEISQQVVPFSSKKLNHLSLDLLLWDVQPIDTKYCVTFSWSVHHPSPSHVVQVHLILLPPGLTHSFYSFLHLMLPPYHLFFSAPNQWCPDMLMPCVTDAPLDINGWSMADLSSFNATLGWLGHIVETLVEKYWPVYHVMEYLWITYINQLCSIAKYIRGICVIDV